MARRGLSVADVRDRRARGLDNAMPDDSGRSFARILAANVFTVFNGVVGGCFVLLIVLGAWQDALFGFFVVANTVIGVVQEFRAKRTLARLAVLNAPRAVVLRDGAELECAVEDVVLGDTLVLRPGEQLSADATLLETRELEVDESLLTGEAEPVRPRAGRELLSGSFVVAGSGLAQVIRVGADSYAARITSEARQFSLVNSELRNSIGRIIFWLSIALIPISAIVVNGQMQAAGGWSEALSSGGWRVAAITSVASIIATVPAGLVFMTSVALAVGAVRLAGGQVLVRELAAVEGLARVDMLCIDKTGTLTEGTMTLDRVEPVEHPPDGWQSALAWFAADPAANTTARALAAEFGPDRAGERPDAVVPFSSRHKWSAVQFGTGSSAGTWVLGGADVVLARSAPGSAVRRRAGTLATTGQRTLVLARSAQPIPETDARTPRMPDGLEPVAVVVLRERVRPDAAEIMSYFALQGVEVCVLSGDEPRTVAAVAREAGLTTAQDGLDARDLPSDPAALADVLRTHRVFGRVTPDQKKAVILALKSLGHTVAMIGDGVNDALALKHADLGIAMGSGSAAARTVAQLVLLDGSFARLPRVVAEGRQVIANVERLARLFLSKTVTAITRPDGTQNRAARRRNPRRERREFGSNASTMAGRPIVIAVTVFAVTAYASMGARAPSAQVQTLAVITLTLSALWVLVILARPFTRATALVVAGSYAGLVAVLIIPLSRDFLGLALPSPGLAGVAVGASAAASLALELLHRALKPHLQPPAVQPPRDRRHRRQQDQELGTDEP